ncbi:MAG: Nif3-like dinuclear metal center hexameric protein [Chitinophagales bacterium]
MREFRKRSAMHTLIHSIFGDNKAQMNISGIISFLEDHAPTAYQEHYDNAGLIIGNPDWECTGVMVSLDATESVVLEARQKKCNLIVAHHPIIFAGLKKINSKNYVEKAVIAAIKNDIAIYAIHTNLDNVVYGVNGKMADKLGLIKRKVLVPKLNVLRKLYSFVPAAHENKVLEALFEAGAGHIGNYSETSFGSQGVGSFRAGEGTTPFVGEKGKRHLEKETKIEVIFPAYLKDAVIRALMENHPYEEVAYDIVELANTEKEIGSGLIGEFPQTMTEQEALALIKKAFQLRIIRHTRLTGRSIGKVAVCGGAGSFLISNALSSGAELFITSDIKYHEFFDANDKILVADIGHFESEQFTIELLHDLLSEKFHTFAVLKPDSITNPVNYYL